MVSLVKQDYNENKKIYEKVETALRNELDWDIPINHVGSTAIPSIKYGKNIIDVLVGAKDEEQFEQIKDILVKDGYVPSQKSKDEIYQFFSSIAGETRFGRYSYTFGDFRHRKIFWVYYSSRLFAT